MRLVWIDPTAVADGADLWAREEAARLLSTMGVTVTWRAAAAGDGVEDDERGVIVLARVARADDGALVLGSTPPHAGGSRFVWVHAESVRAMLGGGPRPDLDFAFRRRLGLALGRVVAHELVHALAPGVPHGQGLMAGRLGRRELQAATLDVDDGVAAALRRAFSEPDENPQAVPAAAALADAGAGGAREPTREPAMDRVGWSAH